MEVYIPPKLDQNCQCICHKQPGVMHVVACCREPEPQMTPTPHLQAAAMRARAAAEATPRDNARDSSYAMGWNDGIETISHRILALPIEADHAALLAEAVKLPGIAALIRDANAVIARWETPSWKDAEPTATVIYALRDTIKALETP